MSEAGELHILLESASRVIRDARYSLDLTKNSTEDALHYLTVVGSDKVTSSITSLQEVIKGIERINAQFLFALNEVDAYRRTT